MKKMFIVVLALAIAMLATVSAQAEWKWELFNVAPFAETRAKAMETRERAFRAAGLPQSVITLLMEETKKPGEKIRLVNGDKLSFMVSKGGIVHKNVVVAFVKPPVSGQMEYAAPAEKWSVMDGVRIFSVILPEICNNWSGNTPAINISGTPSVTPSRTSPATPPQFAKPSTAIAVCPDVYTLKVNVWERRAITLPGVESTHAKEELAKKELKERFVGVSHVSRTHGGQFRKAYADGKILRSATAHDFRVSLIMTPEANGGDSVIASEEILGDIAVTGLRELQFTRAQLEQWDAIRVIPLENTGILSPPRSNLTGVHEMRFFNHLPNKKLGEWENNPVPDCIMNQHWIEE